MELLTSEHIIDFIVFTFMYWLGYRSGWAACAEAMHEKITPVIDRMEATLMKRGHN